tara:strand:+ start:720 stop:917 length:198 start_codon:yes stop_codon:yes gene_type:complete
VSSPYKEVSVSVGKTVNTGDYNSIRADITIVANVDQDDIKTAIDDVREIAMAELKETLATLKIRR